MFWGSFGKCMTVLARLTAKVSLTNVLYWQVLFPFPGMFSCTCVTCNQKARAFLYALGVGR